MPPPADDGTTTVTGLDGQSVCAPAVPAPTATTSVAQTLIHLITILRYIAENE